MGVWPEARGPIRTAGPSEALQYSATVVRDGSIPRMAIRRTSDQAPPKHEVVGVSLRVM